MKSKATMAKDEEIVEKLAGLAGSKLLKKQQRIRATVSLSEAGHGAVKRLSDLKRVKNAEVFRSILDVSEFLRGQEMNLNLDFCSKTKRIRKTYVVDKDSFLQLAEIAKELNCSRDSLIDTVAKLLEVIDEKLSKEKTQKYSEYFRKIQALFNEAEKIEEEIKNTLGEDDPFFSDFNQMVGHMHHWVMELEDHIPPKTPAEQE